MNRRNLLTTTLTAGLALAASPAFAATLSWDPGITGGVTLGGSTTSEATEWKTAGAGSVWYDAAIPGNVAWTNGNDATFAGTAGTVLLGSAVSAGTLNFGTAGYTIDLRDYNGGTATGAAAYGLTATGLSGSNATIRNTSSANAATFTLNLAADTTWGGNIGSGGDRLAFTLTGGRTLNVANVIRAGGSGQLTLTLTGTNTRLNLTGASSTYTGNVVSLGAGTTLDIGNNTNFAYRGLTAVGGSTITTTGTGRITDDSQFDAANFFGTASGTLGIDFASGITDVRQVALIAGNNTHDGGTRVTGALGGTGSLGVRTIHAVHDNALGAGAISLENTGNTATIRFMSQTPSIGSLASSNAGTKSIVLGNTAKATYNVVNTSTGPGTTNINASWTSGSNVITLQGDGANATTRDLAVGQVISSSFGGLPANATITAITGLTTFTIHANATSTQANRAFSSAAVNTTLTVGALNTSTTYGGTITQATGTTGALTKTGTGTLTLGGASSYTGATLVSNGRLNVNGSLASGSAVTVALGATLGGTGTVNGATLVNGTLAPGVSPGTLTIANALTLDAGSTSAFELLGTDTTVGGANNDLVTGVTNLTLDGTLNVTETVAGSFLSASVGDTWRLFNYTGTLTDSGLVLGTMPALSSGLIFDIDTATPNQVNLTVLIPEPASLALVGVAGVLLWPRRRGV